MKTTIHWILTGTLVISYLIAGIIGPHALAPRISFPFAGPHVLAEYHGSDTDGPATKYNRRYVPPDKRIVVYHTSLTVSYRLINDQCVSYAVYPDPYSVDQAPIVFNEHPRDPPRVG